MADLPAIWRQAAVHVSSPHHIRVQKGFDPTILYLQKHGYLPIFRV